MEDQKTVEEKEQEAYVNRTKECWNCGCTLDDDCEYCDECGASRA